MVNVIKLEKCWSQRWRKEDITGPNNAAESIYSMAALTSCACTTLRLMGRPEYFKASLAPAYAVAIMDSICSIVRGDLPSKASLGFIALWVYRTRTSICKYPMGI